MKRLQLVYCAAVLLPAVAAAPAIQTTGYHLTARPWKPLAIPKAKYLDAIEGVCRFTLRHQNSEGAVIDPYLHREHQYATPYYAYAVGTLVHEGRAPDLLASGIKAMEHSTKGFAGGRDSIPDQHGEFFIPVLTGALDLYKAHVPAATLQTWRERLKKPVADVIRGSKNNWETYVFKGEWMRAAAGLAPREETIRLIEDAWTMRHRARIAPEPWRLYHDRTSDPDTLSVEAVGRGNLLALTHLGYNGPSAAEIRDIVERATTQTLYLQDPSGQVPANGRTDDHVWVDVGYQLAFEVMAERAHRKGDAWLAGQFRHAAMNAFSSIGRWRRDDGSFSVTKNLFDPALRIGYQDASQYSNYNGSLMFHLSEAFHLRETEIQENPAPSEIGGYALTLDDEFSSVFANAGGMQLQANLRGQVGASSGNYWTPLGIVRFARPGWETRLGPSDGALTKEGGISFGPAFAEAGKWVGLADLSGRYQGQWNVEFVHPMLVITSLTWAPVAGQSGPSFEQRLVVTPDGVLSRVRKTSSAPGEWGVTWPLLLNDGRPLWNAVTDSVASTGYTERGDRENFIALNDKVVIQPGAIRRSTYGDLRSIRVIASGSEENRTFVYPASPNDPDAEAVRRSFRLTAGGFESVLGKVAGHTYIGRTSAGGIGRDIDIDADGKPDITFSEECGFVLQLRNRRVIAVETDRPVTTRVGGRSLTLKRYTPVTL